MQLKHRFFLFNAESLLQHSALAHTLGAGSLRRCKGKEEASVATVGPISNYRSAVLMGLSHNSVTDMIERSSFSNLPDRLSASKWRRGPYVSNVLQALSARPEYLLPAHEESAFCGADSLRIRSDT